jgi:tetratricopeptide (TPR) repeat protein
MKKRPRQRAARPPAPARADRTGKRRGTEAGRLPARVSRLNPLIAGSTLLVILAGLWAYSTSYAGVLVLDDVRAIALNTTIRTLWPLSGPLSPPPASTVSGRPVANLSFAVNYALAPADARDVFQPGREGGPPGRAERFLRNIRGYHLFNLLIHLAAAVTLAAVIRRTLSSPALAPRFGRHAGPLAATVALVWVTHPLPTAAVTYLVQRVESLAGLFYLLTLYCAIRAWDARRGPAWMAGAITSCALGMATKEVMVTSPIMVALWDWLFGTPAAGTAPSRRGRLLAGLASTWIILTALVLREHRAPSLQLAWDATWRYLLTQTEVIVHYLRLAIVPRPLVFLYSWPLETSPAAVWWQAALLAGLVVLTVAGLMRRHPLAFAGAWFFLILAPSSSLLPIVTEVAAEHRMYLPLAAPVACAVAAVYLAAGRLQQRRRLVGLRSGAGGPPASSWTGWVLAAAATLAVVVALGLTTRARNRDYESDVRLWGDTVAKQPANQRARVAYGSVLASAGRLAEAEVEFRAAVALNVGDPLARGRLGSVLVTKGDLDGAIPHLEYASALRPDDPDMHRWLGQAYAARHDERRAVVHLERAVQLLGDDPILLARLAAILTDADDPAVRDGARALRLAERAVATTARREPMMLNILAVAQASVGRFGDAAATAAEALPLARAQGNQALAAELERRTVAYQARAAAAAR